MQPKKHRNLNPKKRGNRAASKTGRVETIAALTVAGRSHRATVARPAGHHPGKVLKRANPPATASNRGRLKSRKLQTRLRLYPNRQQRRHPPRRRHLPLTARVSNRDGDQDVVVVVVGAAVVVVVGAAVVVVDPPTMGSRIGIALDSRQSELASSWLNDTMPPPLGATAMPP